MTPDETTRAPAAPASPYVQMRALGKVYRSPRGDIEALRNIDLDIGAGEFLSVLGPSGCGKSTLLRCLAGLEGVSSGTVEVRGEAVVEPPAAMGIVFQRDVLLDWRTIMDNVLLPIEFRDLSTDDYVERARELLRMLGLGDYEHRYPWELSGGMRQRAAICRALLEDPPLLLMDEPFGALDAMTRDQLNVELQRVWTTTRKTIMFITHSITEAIFLSDRVAVMARDPGRVEEIVEIDLPRPRRLAMREEARFTVYSAHIRSIFERLGMFQE
ncbi:MAG: ABC transporter ATP-binding protein [Rhodospirillaceae bacterium]